MTDAPEHKRRWPIWLAAFLVLLAGGGFWLLTSASSPLPTVWNPLRPLAIHDPVTALTRWKLRRAAADDALCLSVLSDAVQFEVLPPKQEGEQCGIRNRVHLTALPTSAIEAIETSCAIALRTAMWEVHGLQPAAEQHLGSPVSDVRQIGSYNCRPIRTGRGETARMSTHATADAIDITGFRLADGRSISLIADWDGDDAEAQFLRAARRSACTWFVTVLSPDYNALHADHFHLQSRGWGTCR